jgi:Tfp pilus assembly protein PilO
MQFRTKILNKARVRYAQEQRQNELNAIFTVVFLVIIGGVFIVPSIRSTKDLLAQKNQLVSEKDALEKIDKDYHTAASYMDEAGSFKNKIEAKIPVNPEVASVIGSLTHYATKSNLSLSNISLIEKQNGVETYQMQFSGGFSQIQTFFKNIDIGDRYLKITRMAVYSKSSRSNDTGELYLIITVKAFYNDKPKS